MRFEDRAVIAKNPAARKMLEIMADKRSCLALANDEHDTDLEVNTQEQVSYERYCIDAYITFHDDGESESVFSIKQIDDLIEALYII